jgi:hypothetical protein
MNTPEKCPTCNRVSINTPHTCFGFAPKVETTENEWREVFAKEFSEKVRFYAGKGQYPDDEVSQKTYLDGVDTAIAMMYIDLTGTPKTKGMLQNLLDTRDAQIVEKVEETDFFAWDENTQRMIKNKLIEAIKK